MVGTRIVIQNSKKIKGGVNIGYQKRARKDRCN